MRIQRRASLSWLFAGFCAAAALAPVSAAAQEPGGEAESQEAARSADEAVDARITAVTGEVTVFSRGQDGEGASGAEGVPAKAGMPLEDGDRVVTGAESGAELGLEGDSVLELGQDTDFTVTSLDRRKTRFGLLFGSLLAKVNALFKSGGGLRVETPVAVAAVRGTEFGVEQEKDGPGHVGVFDEGKVALTSPEGAGGEALLTANREASIERGTRDFSAVSARPLERFRLRRGRMRRVAVRAKGLRRGWKRLSPNQRRGVRRRILERQGRLMRRIRERRRDLKNGPPQERMEERRRRRMERRERRGERRSNP